MHSLSVGWTPDFDMSSVALVMQFVAYVVLI